MRTPTQNHPYIILEKFAYVRKIIPVLYRSNFAYPIQNHPSIILEKFCVGYVKSPPYYIGVILRTLRKSPPYYIEVILRTLRKISPI